MWSAGGRLRVENVQVQDIEPDASLDVFDSEGSKPRHGRELPRHPRHDRQLPPTLARQQDRRLGRARRRARRRLRLHQDRAVLRQVLDRIPRLPRPQVDHQRRRRRRLHPRERPIAYLRALLRRRAIDVPWLRKPRRGAAAAIRANTLTVGDQPIGGDWLLLAGAQYEFPLVDNFLRGVVFTDQGVLSDEPTLKQWRITVGMGIRLNVAFLSQAPFAVDLAIPLASEDGDQERILSFALDIPL